MNKDAENKPRLGHKPKDGIANKSAHIVRNLFGPTTEAAKIDTALWVEAAEALVKETNEKRLQKYAWK